MSRASFSSFLGRKNAKALLFGGNRMVASDRPRLTFANEVAARITDMSDGGTVKTQGAHHDGACHPRSRGIGKCASSKHARIRRLHEAHHQLAMGCHVRYAPEPAQHFLDCSA